MIDAHRQRHDILYSHSGELGLQSAVALDIELRIRADDQDMHDALCDQPRRPGTSPLCCQRIMSADQAAEHIHRMLRLRWNDLIAICPQWLRSMRLPASAFLSCHYFSSGHAFDIAEDSRGDGAQLSHR